MMTGSSQGVDDGVLSILAPSLYTTNELLLGLHPGNAQFVS